MPIGLMLLLGFITVLLIAWLVVASKEPPIKRRNAAGYRHQQSENPDYMPKGLGV